MPSANRYFVPGFVWHITHRCHKQEFLLKFARDRRTWTRWLFEARKRFGLCVLNYTVTSSHIHLLVKDTCRTFSMNTQTGLMPCWGLKATGVMPVGVKVLQ